MSISLYSVSPVVSPAASPAGIGSVGQKMFEVLRAQDARITGDINAALAPESPLMDVPETVKAQFRRFENTPMSPEEKRLVKEVKARVSKLYENNRNYIEDKSRSNIENIYIEITAKASGKVMSAIQQLLSDK